MIPIFNDFKNSYTEVGCLWCSETLRTDFEKKTDWDKVGRKHLE